MAMFFIEEGLVNGAYIFRGIFFNLPQAGAAPLTEVTEWCDNNFGAIDPSPKIKIRWGRIQINEDTIWRHMVFYFVNVDDAALFKLQWPML